MASLTPLSKGLIGLAVIGAMASAVWHLGLKDQFASLGASTVTNPANQTPNTQVASAEPARTSGESAAIAVPTPTQLVAVPLASAPPQALRQLPASKLSPAENAEAGRKLLGEGNFAQARLHLEQAVQGGDAGAACLLGEMTLKGQGGIPANQEKSAKLFQFSQSRNIICFASSP
jgi:TPR repeat protein